MMQMEPVVVDQAGALVRCDEEFFDTGGSGETQNGAAAEVEFTGDGAQAVAALDAFVDLLVTLTGAGDQGTWSSVDIQLGEGGRRRRGDIVLAVPERERFSQVSAMSADDAFDCLAQVVQQVRRDAQRGRTEEGTVRGSGGAGCPCRW